MPEEEHRSPAAGFLNGSGFVEISWGSARHACVICSSRPREGPLHHLRRRARRSRQGARHRTGDARGARADAEPAAGRAGRLRHPRGGHLDGGHQPPRDPDLALLRAGRFDRQVLVDRPTARGASRSSSCTPARSPSTRPRTWRHRRMTAGFVGADLANIINEAALLGVRRERDWVGLAELQEAVERIVAGLRRRTGCSPRPRRSGSRITSSGTRLVAALQHGDDIHKISIVRGNRRARLHLAIADRGSLPDDRERAQGQGGHPAGRPRRRGAHLRRGLDRRARRSEQGDRHRAAW